MAKRKMTRAKALSAAADLVAQGWCQHHKRSPDGYSLDGALWAVTDGGPLYGQCQAVCSRQLGGASLWKWNDMRNRTQADVVALLREAATGRFSAPSARMPEYEHADVDLLGLSRLIGLTRARDTLWDARLRCRDIGNEFSRSAEWQRFWANAAYAFVAHPENAEEEGHLSDADAENFANGIARCAGIHHHWCVSRERLAELFGETAHGVRGTALIQAAARFMVAQEEPGREYIQYLRRTTPPLRQPWSTGGS